MAEAASAWKALEAELAAWAEAGRVSWPSRKETLQTTGIVFVFVALMALFLFAVDASLAAIVKLMTGRGES